jgi:hypothetical protein
MMIALTAASASCTSATTPGAPESGAVRLELFEQARDVDGPRSLALLAVVTSADSIADAPAQLIIETYDARLCRTGALADAGTAPPMGADAGMPTTADPCADRVEYPLMRAPQQQRFVSIVRTRVDEPRPLIVASVVDSTGHVRASVPRRLGAPPDEMDASVSSDASPLVDAGDAEGAPSDAANIDAPGLADSGAPDGAPTDAMSTVMPEDAGTDAP